MLHAAVDPLTHAAPASAGNPDDSADFLANSVECCTALRGWQTIDAIELLNWQQSANGTTAAAWYLWAVHKAMTGTLEGTDRLLDLCLQNNPASCEALAYRQALAMRSGDIATASTCGMKLGSLVEASPTAQQAAELYTKAHKMLPYPTQHPAAAALLAESLALAPWDARAWYALALTVYGSDPKYCAALATEAVIRNPLLPEAWALAIAGLALSGQISAAGRAVGCAISLFPDNAMIIGIIAHLNAVGGVFDPGIDRAWYTQPEGRLPATYLKSLTRRRDHSAQSIHKEQVLPAYGTIGSHELAVKAFSKTIAFNLFPESAEDYAEQVTLLAKSAQDFANNRNKLSNPLPIVGTPFQWQVTDENACGSLSVLADALRASCPALTYQAATTTAIPGKLRRVAVISSVYGDRWSRATGGLLESLSPEQFQVRHFLPVLSQSRSDLATADDTLLPVDLAAARTVIASFAPDIVIYPAMGMNPWLYQLAFSRLAPVQIALGQQRITTGLDTIDYFVSAAAFEPADAAQHYREKLVTLPGLGAVLQASSLPEIAPDRAAHNLPNDALILFCAQPWPKIMPGADAMLVQLLHKLPQALLVIPDALGGYGELIKKRLGKVDPAVLTQLKFTDRLQRHDYQAMQMMADLILDGFPSSIGFAALDALAYGTPVITMRGQTARCRTAAGLLSAMGAEELVTDNLADYCDRVMALGQDQARRAALSDKLRQNVTKLLNDRAPATAFAQLLQQVS
jgi:tetratricopeptide (TPR) repeat protein